MSNCNIPHRLLRTFHTNSQIHINSNPGLYILPVRALRDFVPNNKVEIEFNEVLTNSLQLIPSANLPPGIDEERIKMLNDDNTWNMWKSGESVNLFYDGPLIKYKGKMNLNIDATVLPEYVITATYSAELNQPDSRLSINYTPFISYAYRPELTQVMNMDISFSQWLDMQTGVVNDVWNKPKPAWTGDFRTMQSLAGTFFLVFSRNEKTIDFRIDGPENAINIGNFIKLDSSSSELDIKIKAEEYDEMLPFSFSLSNSNWNFNQIKE